MRNEGEEIPGSCSVPVALCRAYTAIKLLYARLRIYVQILLSDLKRAILVIDMHPGTRYELAS